MAQKKNGTSSGASKKPAVAKVSSVGRQSASVAAIREQARIDDERRAMNFANAEDGVRTLKDLSKGNRISRSITAADRETIEGYLTGNIAGNGDNLIKASRYLYYRSQIYRRLCHFYTDMFCLECRKVSPKFDLTKEPDAKKMLKQYNGTLDFLDVISLKNTLNPVLLNSWIEDISFNLFFHDDTGSFFYRIEPDEAFIDSQYMASGGSCYGFAMDMSKWKSAERQKIIEAFGSPLKEMYDEYDRTNIKYVHVPPEYSAVFKVQTDLYDMNVPPFLAMMNSLANLNDLVDQQAEADELSIYKLVYLPMKVLSGASQSDDFEVSPKIMLEYFDKLQAEALPANVSSAPIPGDELKVIDFSGNVDTDVNRVDRSQTQILGSAGGAGALLDAQRAINNSALIKAALQNESAYATAALLPQIEAWTNLQLKLNVNNYCKVSYFPITIYTKEDFRKTLLEGNQHGFMARMAYGTLLGFSEREMLSALVFEQEALKLHERMQFPLVSSYTQSGTGEAGRPETDVTELSPSGDRSRDE